MEFGDVRRNEAEILQRCRPRRASDNTGVELIPGLDTPGADAHRDVDALERLEQIVEVAVDHRINVHQPERAGVLFQVPIKTDEANSMVIATRRHRRRFGEAWTLDRDRKA